MGAASRRTEREFNMAFECISSKSAMCIIHSDTETSAIIESLDLWSIGGRHWVMPPLGKVVCEVLSPHVTSCATTW